MTTTTTTTVTRPGRRGLRQAVATAALALLGTTIGAALAAEAADPPDARWHALQASRWIQDGRADAPRVVYQFTDPNCPYCNKLWTDSRPWVDAGRVQIRHVMVAILTPSSAAKAAALLDAPDSARALADYERRAHAPTAAMLASGHVRPLGDDTPSAAAIPAAAQAALDDNLRLMKSLHLQATPAAAWLDDSGALQVRQGLSPADQSQVFGPR